MTENFVSVWMAQGRHYRVRFVDTTHVFSRSHALEIRV